jgi:hypothetical protein
MTLVSSPCNICYTTTLQPLDTRFRAGTERQTENPALLRTEVAGAVSLTVRRLFITLPRTRFNAYS